ncbi:hypothetical protein [Frankia sp. AgB32]|uniref:hypothetical protein n=1 Tax=Frankia sp. AgB32 TaxID=631119 RepID=UPI00200CBCB2|nr:hypothetical protein [Frankia sp. AgB32]MCK9894761.1 hypothetical protein [Frankia sp. AgB32]
MDINPPWPRGGSTPPEVVTFLSRTDGAAVSIAPHPGAEPGTPLVLLDARMPGAPPAALRLVPQEALRLAELLVEAAESGAPAQAPDLAVSPGGRRISGAGLDGSALAHRRWVVAVPEGAAPAELGRALTLLPQEARLVDFSSDTDVVLVFATADPRWPARPDPAG